MLGLFLGPVKNPKSKFLFNVFWVFVIISFLYFIQYDSSIQINLELEGKYTQEALQNERMSSAIKHYGVFLLFFIWQYRKWITHGRINSLRTQNTTCECKVTYQASKYNCPQCQTANPLMQEAIPSKISPAKAAPINEKPKKKNDNDKIDPKTASFKNSAGFNIENYIRTDRS